MMIHISLEGKQKHAIPLAGSFWGGDENKSYGRGLPYTEKKPGLLSLFFFLGGKIEKNMLSKKERGNSDKSIKHAPML